MASLISVEEAQSLLLDHISPTSLESCNLPQALGRTLREDFVSHQSSPLFDKSLMDGYAVRTQDLTSDVVTLDVLEMVSAGEVGRHEIAEGETVQIMTGAPLPNGADAVIPVEKSQPVAEKQRVELQTSGISPETNLIRAGAILREGQTLISAGTVIRPAEIALLAEYGRADISVSRRPFVSILATGDELVPAGESLGPGQIRNSNAPMLESQVASAGAIPNNLGIGRDRLDDLREKIAAALTGDFLLLSGGVSAGEKDLVPQVLKECGVREIFHKVRVKPGKPLWFGVQEKPDGKKTYVFGLPGNPVSSMLCFEVFVRTAIRQFLGQSHPLPVLRKLRLGKAHVAAGGRPTYYPSQFVSHPDGLSVEPVDWKGSSDLFAPTQADCWILFPAGDREWPVGEMVDVLIPAL
ncbi:MAG: molybdopterin molybdotransferase MoeA [Planctomycetaceae bacterium]|nr:molybdopterin molybdotransferase MoeA [Planctomycetaceae bacterium]